MDADGKAIFEAAEDLEDAKVYTVTSEDLSVPANTTVRAEVVKAYANEFFTNTEKISDKNKVVVFQAKDQYGEVMDSFPDDAEVTVTWKEMPLVKNTDYTVSEGKVTVQKDIPAGNELTFNVTLKATDEEKEDVTFSKTFEVEEGKEAALTSVAEVTASQEEVKPEDTVTLTASFLDQYKNEITLGTSDEIRWVIKEGADLITVDNETGNVINKTGENAGTLSYTAKKPGKVAIEVFVTATGESAPYEVTIGEADLKEITVEKITLGPDEKIYNNKDKAIATIKPNEGAKMTPEDVKFEVVDGNGEDASEVVTVKAQEPEVKEGEEVKKDAPLNIVVNSTKSGTYKVTPYIEVDGKKVYSKDDSVKAIEFTTEVENNITAISELDFSDKTELKVDKEIRKDITFTNEHGEPVLVETEASKEADKDRPKATITTTLEAKIVDKVEEVNGESKVIGQEIVIKADKAGKAVLFIDAGENAEPASYNLEFVKAVLTDVEFGEGKVTGLVAGEKTPKYNKVTFKDQHGVQMPKPEQGLEIIVTDKDGKVVNSEGVQFVQGNFNEEGAFDENAEDAEDFIKIVSSDDELNGTYTITVTDKKTDEGAVAEDAKVKESFEVEVGEARKVEDIEVKPVSSTVAAGASTKFIITVKDQYGEAFDLDDMKAVLKDEEQEGLTIGDVEQSKDGDELIKGQYEFTVEAASTAGGEYVLVVGVQPTEATEGAEATEGVTKEVTITVGAGSDLVKSLEITGENIKDGKAEFPYFVDTKEEITTLGIKAFGEEGKEVNYETDKVSWSVNNDNVTVTDGKVTVDPEIFGDKEDVTFTVTAKHYGVTESIDLTVSKAPSKVQDGTIEVSLPAEEGKEPEAVTVVTIDKDAKDGQVTVTYSATDQYGKDANLEGMEFLSYNEGVATVAEELTEDNALVITAVKEGKTQIEATIDGLSHMFDVIVTKEAAEAAELAQAKKDAKKALKEYKKAEDYTTNEAELNQAITAGETAIDAAKDKAAVDKALEEAKKAIDAIESDEKIAENEATQALEEANEALQKALEDASGEEVADYIKNDEAVKAAVDKATDELKESADAEEINKVTKEINAAVAVAQAEKALEDAKQAAENDQTVTDAVNKAKEDAIKEVQAVQDAQGVLDALKPEGEVTDVKSDDAEAAKTALNEALSAAEDEEVAKNTDVTKAVEKAETVKNSEDATEIDKVTNEINKAVKAAKVANATQALKAAKEEAANDKTVTDAVNKAKEEAIKEVQAVKDAQDALTKAEAALAAAKGE